MASASASRRLLAGGLLAAALLVTPRPARADVSAIDKAAAEALFEDAKVLMKQGRFPSACAKFQESQRLDPGIGTMLYLGDCFEKNGQTASAWGQFLDAAAAARAAGQFDREKKARDRATALETKLNRLSITLLPGADLPGLEVKRDGVFVAKATFGTAVPLDPGTHTVDATAPGKKPWSTRLQVDAGNLAGISLVIPVLEDPPPPPPKVEPPKVEPPRVLIDEPGRPAPRLVAPPPIVRETTSPARVTGGVLVGVGLATGAVGGIIGSVALLKNADSKANCYPNGACTQAGIDSRNAALGLSTGVNVSLIIGGTLFATGLVILLATTPPPAADRQVFQIAPMIGVGSGGLSARGVF